MALAFLGCVFVVSFMCSVLLQMSLNCRDLALYGLWFLCLSSTFTATYLIYNSGLLIALSIKFY